MRKIIATILIVVLGFCPVFSYTVLYQDQTNETIHQGLEYLEMRRFTSEGWVDVHVIKADLKDPRLHFVPLYSDSGLGNRATVPAMLEEKDATVGINGDFFYKADQYSPVGITVEDGALLTSPADLSKSFPSILVSQENEISFPIIPWEISIFHPFGVTKAYSVNKTTSEYTVPRIFTGKFTGKTLGNRIPLLEILIEEGVITQIYRNNPSVSIPKEGTLIAVDLVHAPAELNLLRVGDPVTVQNQMESFYEDASTAVGAGAYLLQDGIIPKFALNIEGKHPRSAVGTNYEKDTFYMVAVNGRGDSFRGLEQSEFASLLLELGLWNAVNFDGGGSTTLAKKDALSGEYQILNTPSDGSPRKVINGLGLKYDVIQGTLSSLQVKCVDENIFLGTGRTLSFYGTDSYGNVSSILPYELSMNVEKGSAQFVDGKLYPLSPGELKVNFQHKNLSLSKTFHVLKEAKALDTSLDLLQFDTNGIVDLNPYIQNISGINDEGFSAKIEKQDIHLTAYGSIGTISDNLLATSKTQHFGGISISSGKAIKNVMVQIGYEEILLDGLDTLENKEPASYPESVNSKIALATDAKQGKASIRLFYDFTVTDKTRGSYLAFSEPLVLESPVLGLAVDIYGNGYGHWLRGKLEDGDGKIQVVDFNRSIDYVGFKTEKAILPANIKYPVKIHRIYLAETNPNTQNTGSVLLDNLRALKNAPMGMVSLPPETIAIDPLRSLSPDGKQNLVFTPSLSSFATLFDRHTVYSIFENANTVFSVGSVPKEVPDDLLSKAKSLEGSGVVLDTGDLKMVKYTSNRGIRKGGVSQWTQLISTLDSTQKPLIIYLSGPMYGQNGFSDKLERQLFEEKVEDYGKNKNSILVIMQSDVYSSRVHNNVRYLTVPFKTPITIDNATTKKKLIVQLDKQGLFHYDFVPLFTK